MKDWNNLDPQIRKSKNISIFKSNILKFIRSEPNNIYYCHNPNGIKLLVRLRLDLSHLRKHRFKHSFQDCLDPLCLCSNGIETSTHYLLHCPTYTKDWSFWTKSKVLIVAFQNLVMLLWQKFSCFLIKLLVILLIPHFELKNWVHHIYS